MDVEASDLKRQLTAKITISVNFLFFIILFLVSLEHSVKNDLKEMAYWGVRI